MTIDILNYLENGEIAERAFLNISDAFDNTFHAAITGALQKKDVDKAITNWVSKVLATRSAETTMSISTIEVGTTRDTPQGGICPALIWSLELNYLTI